MKTFERGLAWRRRSRVLAMQALCQLEAQGDAFLSHLNEFLWEAADASELHDAPPEELRPSIESVRDYASRLARGAWEDRERHDALIRATVTNWEPGRLTMVDRAILRMAVHEMRTGGDTPVKVIINEAIELAKQFGTSDSARFVNGVLDAVFKREAGTAEQAQG